MSVCPAPPLQVPVASVPAARSPGEIDRTVQLVLSAARAKRPVCERRRATRHPFPYPVRLIPLAADGSPLADASVFGVGKHLSQRGLDFYSAQPLPFRRAIVHFEGNDGGAARLLIDLTWCRFCGPGWYENGGRFLPSMPTAETSLEALVEAMLSLDRTCQRRSP